MAKKSDIIDQMMANPAADWSIDDVLKAARREGLIARKASTGSHYTFASPHSQLIRTVPFKRPIKPCYIRDFAKLAKHHRKCEKEAK